MKTSCFLLLGLLASTIGCKSESAELEDASTEAAVRYLTAGDLRVVLLPGWVTTPVGAQEASYVQSSARRIDPAMSVAPKLVFTREPTEAQSPDDAFAVVKSQLEGLAKNPKVTMERTQMVTRVLPFGSVADIEIRYSFESSAKPKPTLLVHRTLVSLRSLSESELAIVALTATYLAEDAKRVSAEVDTIFDSLEMATGGSNATAKQP